MSGLSAASLHACLKIAKRLVTTIATPPRWLARALVFVDNKGVDGVVNGTAALLGGSSGRLRRLQTGFVRSYALSMLGGGVLVIAALLAIRLIGG